LYLTEKNYFAFEGRYNRKENKRNDEKKMEGLLPYMVLSIEKDLKGNFHSLILLYEKQ